MNILHRATSSKKQHVLRHLYTHACHRNITVNLLMIDTPQMHADGCMAPMLTDCFATVAQIRRTPRQPSRDSEQRSPAGSKRATPTLFLSGKESSLCGMLCHTLDSRPQSLTLQMIFRCSASVGCALGGSLPG